MPYGIYVRTEKHKIQCIKNLKTGMLGKHLSEEAKRKMSIAHTGKKMSLAARAKMSIATNKYLETHIHPSKGKKLSEEHIKKMSEFRKTRIGALSANWKGGAATEKWRKKRNKRVYHCRRRTWEKNGGELTYKILQLVYEDNIKKHGTLTCYLCFSPIDFGKDTIDHKIPLSRGGTNQYNNLAISCRSCNCKKNARTLKEYRRILDEMAKK